MSEWIRVSKAHPCPVCGKPDWCSIKDNGEVCHCMRSQSATPCLSGGWFHFTAPIVPRASVPMPRRVRRALFDAEATMAGFRAELKAEDAANAPGWSNLRYMAEDLNLPARACERLRAGKSAFHRAWAFPMLDGDGKCVGIRLREWMSNNKWSVAGSRDGLFYDPTLEPKEIVANGVKARELVIVEGATDCIAGYDLGLPCVGRSACMTGAAMIGDLCRRLRVGRLTIVTDNDAYKRRADGTLYRPGIEGARKLAADLGRTYRLVTPPYKDLREWYYNGLTPQMFWDVAALQTWRI